VPVQHGQGGSDYAQLATPQSSGEGPVIVGIQLNAGGKMQYVVFRIVRSTAPFQTRSIAMQNFGFAAAVCLMLCLAFGSASADDAQSTSASPIVVPDGYVLQKLDVTDGSIARPNDWYYDNHGTPSGWLWTISKEDPSKGPFQTGLHIQLFAGFKKYNITPLGFAQDFFQRTRQKDTVVSDCPVSHFGQFDRQCLEVLEDNTQPTGPKRYHIQYSVIWTPDGDMAIITTFGAPEEDWDSVKPIAQVMSAFVIIGRNFGKQ
jgi:hypothetical protein